MGEELSRKRRQWRRDLKVCWTTQEEGAKVRFEKRSHGWNGRKSGSDGALLAIVRIGSLILHGEETLVGF
jgi:hypothetical protein